MTARYLSRFIFRIFLLFAFVIGGMHIVIVLSSIIERQSEIYVWWKEGIFFAIYLLLIFRLVSKKINVEIVSSIFYLWMAVLSYNSMSASIVMNFIDGEKLSSLAAITILTGIVLPFFGAVSAVVEYYVSNGRKSKDGSP